MKKINKSKLLILYTLISVLSLSMLCPVSVYASNLGNSVSTDTSFQKNDYLMSQNGQYKACFQSDGNFVVYNSSWQPLWASNTAGSGVRCRFEDGGNLVIRDYEVIQKRIMRHINYGTTPIYKTINVYKNENANTIRKRVVTELHINVNTHEILTQSYDWIIISSTQKPNTKKELVSTHAVKDPDPAFGVVSYTEWINVPKNEVIWASHTEGGYTGSNTLIMQNDGNLVIYDENNNPVWATGTN